MLRSSFSILIFFLVTSVYAQDTQLQPQMQADTTRTYERGKPDSLRQKFELKSFRVGTDVLGIIISQVDQTIRGWELNGDLDLGKFYLAVDYGSWGRDYELPNNGFYENNGTYWRAGIDMNLLLKDPDRNMFFFGFRYARSSFSESTRFEVTDQYFGDYERNLTNPSVKAGWVEIVTGLRVKMFSEFWMGYTARMKFARSVSGDDAFSTYDIPGYGLNAEAPYWGFNYQVFWRIPIKKQK